MYFNTKALQQAGVALPTDTWTHEDFLTTARAMRKGKASVVTDTMG